MLRGLKQMCLLTLIMIHEVTWYNISALLPVGHFAQFCRKKKKLLLAFHGRKYVDYYISQRDIFKIL